MFVPPLAVTLNGQSPTQVQHHLDALIHALPDPPWVIEDRDPERFVLKVLAGIQRQATLILANPAWQQREREQLQDFLRSAHPTPVIAIPTGGSTAAGRITWIPHTLTTLITAAQGFQSQYPHAHSVVVLPPYHVSGLMPLFRAWVNQGSLTLLTWSDFLAHPPTLTDASLSLVPTQLQRLVRDPDWVVALRSARMIVIGGAPLWPSLRHHCLELGIPIALSYGMTETAAAAAVIPPQEMHQEGYTPLPHMGIEVDPSGRIILSSAAIPGGRHLSDDLGAWDPQGRLLWQGRLSGCVNSGGEKIMPNEVEAVIWQSGLVEDIWVGGIPDPEWGERLIAVYVGEAGLVARLEPYVRERLAPFKCPKTWIPVAAIPRQAQGKISRAAIGELITTALGSPP